MGRRLRPSRVVIVRPGGVTRGRFEEDRIRERRQELARLVRQRIEEGKVALRNIRREALDDMREFEKEKLVPEDDFYRGKDGLQDLTDQYAGQMDEISGRKQREILEG